jgi:hypothetical protein
MPWRLRAKATGVCVWVSAKRQASAVSFAPAGRIMYRFGVARRWASCSIGWCVGPSSPSPIESCVNTIVAGRSMIAASRIAGFM